jgi:ubiquinone/menaquinone biosynthesis C-methylase UbiE
VTHSHRAVGRFDRWASTYDQSYLQRLVFEPVQRTLLEVASSEKPGAAATLDVGCGTGRLLRAAEGLFPGARLEGVDAAPAMVKRALAESESGITFREGVAEQLPFGDAEFDLVFSTMTFHHWADQRQGAAEVARVMQPDGRWLLADFVPKGILRLVMSRRFPRQAPLERILGEAGLGIQSQRSVAGLGGQVGIIVVGTTRR